MDPELLEILRDALSTRLRREELQRALGRAVRRRSLGFDKYVETMSELRSHAEKRGLTLEEAAEELLSR
ncbi:MAG: hypothetical protein MUO94_00210 [Thermoplasmata archaeon]|jgi:hypothetical protein|nr:hypothetical protein [Thermoplasmata archaeon]